MEMGMKINSICVVASMLCYLCMLASCNIEHRSTCSYQVVSVTPPMSNVRVFHQRDLKRNIEIQPPLTTRCCKFLELRIDDERIKGKYIERIELTEAGTIREIQPDQKRVSPYLLQEIPLNFSDEVERVRIYMRDEESEISEEEDCITINLKGECSAGSWSLLIYRG